MFISFLFAPQYSNMAGYQDDNIETLNLSRVRWPLISAEF